MRAFIATHSTKSLSSIPIYRMIPNPRTIDSIVKLLLHRLTYFSGASIDLWDSDGLSPLLIAACEGHDDVVATLILLGARLDLADNDEKSALYWAAEQNHPKVVRVRIDLAFD